MPPVRLHKMSKKERKDNPPTGLELHLGRVLSQYSMLLRGGRTDAADELFKRQTPHHQALISKECEKKMSNAMRDIQVGGRVMLASERKSIAKEEKELGRELTAEEVDECLEKERTRPRNRKNKPPKIAAPRNA